MPMKNIPNIERRSFPVKEMRASDDPDSRVVTGHAAVFDTLSNEMWEMKERIAPGAFTESIKVDDVRALWNHNPENVLARTKSGTLKLNEDDVGLAFEMDVAETQAGNDLLVSLRRGDVDEMSFGFITLEDEWTQEPEQLAIRTLKKVRLMDVSPVTFPAYPDTDVATRSHEAWKAKSAPASDGAHEARARRLRLAEAELG